LNAVAGPVEVTLQYLIRKDTNPWFRYSKPDKETETRGIVAEIIYSPKLDKSRFYLTGLYNRIESEYISTEIDENATINGTYLLARNIKMLVEYTRFLQYDGNRFVIGLVSGF